MMGYQAYQKNKYETASPHRLITMLYEGVIRFANQAINEIESSNIQGSNLAIKRMQDIVYELIACLNFKEGKEIAEQLHPLYQYVIDLSVRSNLEKTVDPLKEAILIITDIKSSWEQIGKDVALSNG